MGRKRPSLLWCWDGTGQCDVDETVDCRACLLPLVCSAGVGAPSSPAGTMFQKQLRVGRTPQSQAKAQQKLIPCQPKPRHETIKTVQWHWLAQSTSMSIEATDPWLPSVPVPVRGFAGGSSLCFCWLQASSSDQQLLCTVPSRIRGRPEPIRRDLHLVLSSSRWPVSPGWLLLCPKVLAISRT